MITNDGRDYLMDNGFTGPFYIGLYTANRAILPTDTLSSFLADAMDSIREILYGQPTFLR